MKILIVRKLYFQCWLHYCRNESKPFFLALVAQLGLKVWGEGLKTVGE